MYVNRYVHTYLFIFIYLSYTETTRPPRSNKINKYMGLCINMYVYYIYLYIYRYTYIFIDIYLFRYIKIFIYLLYTETTRPPRSNENGLLNSKWVHGREQGYSAIPSIWISFIYIYRLWSFHYGHSGYGHSATKYESLTCIGANSIGTTRTI